MLSSCGCRQVCLCCRHVRPLCRVVLSCRCRRVVVCRQVCLCCRHVRLLCRVVLSVLSSCASVLSSCFVVVVVMSLGLLCSVVPSWCCLLSLSVFPSLLVGSVGLVSISISVQPLLKMYYRALIVSGNKQWVFVVDAQREVSGRTCSAGTDRSTCLCSCRPLMKRTIGQRTSSKEKKTAISVNKRAMRSAVSE